MKKYITINDIKNIKHTVQEAIQLKNDPYQFENLGKYKTLVMLFFNASLRTRLSTEKAAKSLGMDVMILNIKDCWNLEYDNGTVMDLTKAEHIKEAANVISQYGDVIAIRAFPSLTDKEKDETEQVLHSFVKYASVPIVNLESATSHPLQALADAITISELKTTSRPKVVLTWAPHPKALPHAVANSFIKIMKEIDVDLLITHPKHYELNSNITEDVTISYNQEEALKDSDFVYAKNWSNYQDYGKIVSVEENWMLTNEKLGNEKFMHCLPVRRNVELSDEILDSSHSLVTKQAGNRVWAAQAVLQTILTHQQS